ncbi:MAG TPA: DNA polymerase III subunit gamma/tau, partial [Nitrospiria bacterium]|nr:DNA polymerase III subunit gamma/tau [Nitrospiria bacterium]
MSYQVSARKWRPQTFSEVVGQSHVAKTLMNAVRQGRIAQAYLFSGSRGVGKTTMARILAKALNCSEREKGDGVTPCQTCESCQGITAGTSPDVIEIDGASNRGIDEVRELREVVKYAPMGGRHKVYIIDEVHMLTKEAFNALLKTLEEPPPHIVFVFATTEDNKIPTTILSRCQHFNFKRISRQETSDQLKKIIGEENLELSDRGLSMIAKAAEGSLRDALSLLDQAVAYAGKAVSDEDLQTILGTAGREQVLVMLEHVIERRTAEGLSLVKELSDQGYDLRQFTLSLVEYFRHLVVARETKNPGELIDLPPDEIEEVRRMAEKTGTEEVQRLFGIFSAAVEGF